MNYEFSNNEGYYIAIFNSKNHAIRLNYTLEKKGYRKFRLISTPCRLSNGCSYSLKFFKLSDLEYLRKEVSQYENIIKDIYEVTRVNGKRVYKKVNYPI